MRHAVFAHGDLDLHAGIVNLTKHLRHTPHWLAIQRRRLGEFHHHHLARLGRAGGPLGNQYILAIALVLWRHQPDTTFLQQTTDDGLLRSFEDFNHAPFRAAFAVKPHHADLDAVLVQHGTHFIGRQVDVRLTVITHQKAMAIAMALNLSFDFFQHPAGWSHFFDIQSLAS